MMKEKIIDNWMDGWMVGWTEWIVMEVWIDKETEGWMEKRMDYG